jgi:hypothetical protein
LKRNARPLSEIAMLAGWNSPRSTYDSNGGPNQAGGALSHDAAIAGWPSPMAGSPATDSYNEAGNNDASRKTVALAGWMSPRTPTGGGKVERTTPGGGLRKLEDQVSGLISPSFPAEMVKSGALNPEHSRWLMGFPIVWANYAPTVTRLSRKSRRSS